MNEQSKAELNAALAAAKPSPEDMEDEEDRADRLKAESDAWNEQQEALAVTINQRLEALSKQQALAAEEPDLVLKADLLLRCRMEHANLRKMAKNVTDVCKKLDIVVDFLGNMNSTLTAMDSKLTLLLSSVSVMRTDLLRLTGKPVLEEFDERRQNLFKRCAQFRGCVYIPIDGATKNAKDEGTGDVSSLLEKVDKEFLNSPPDMPAQVLLLSGAAGSGKSTFVKELELMIETKYRDEREKQARSVNVVLIKANLPTLTNPLSDLFHETLSKDYHLRDTQIFELRTLAREGKVELVFLLDAYDELKHQFLHKNLYRSNNLEQYRATSPDDSPDIAANSECFPKVIITTRSEVLSGVPNYALNFLPLESENEAKDEVKEARAYFAEYRLAAFDNKLESYVHSLVALHRMQGFQSLFSSKLVPLNENKMRYIKKMIRTDVKVEDDGDFHSPQKIVDAMIDALVPQSQTSKWIEIRDNPSSAAIFTGDEAAKDQRHAEDAWNVTKRDMDREIVKDRNVDKTSNKKGLMRLLQILCFTLPSSTSAQDISKHFKKVIAKLAYDDTWLARRYLTSFDSISELKQLVNTPFMTKIVMDILKKLSGLKNTVAGMKTQLILQLGEDASETVWAILERIRKVPVFNTVTSSGGAYEAQADEKDALKNAATSSDTLTHVSTSSSSRKFLNYVHAQLVTKFDKGAYSRDTNFVHLVVVELRYLAHQIVIPDRFKEGALKENLKVEVITKISNDFKGDQDALLEAIKKLKGVDKTKVEILYDTGSRRGKFVPSKFMIEERKLHFRFVVPSKDFNLISELEKINKTSMTSKTKELFGPEPNFCIFDGDENHDEDELRPINELVPLFSERITALKVKMKESDSEAKTEILANLESEFRSAANVTFLDYDKIQDMFDVKIEDLQAPRDFGVVKKAFTDNIKDTAREVADKVSEHNCSARQHNTRSPFPSLICPSTNTPNLVASREQAHSAVYAQHCQQRREAGRRDQQRFNPHHEEAADPPKPDLPPLPRGLPRARG